MTLVKLPQNTEIVAFLYTNNKLSEKEQYHLQYLQKIRYLNNKFNKEGERSVL